MINLADKYISDHGLRFNPLMTECVSFGQNHFVSSPVWSLRSVSLANSTGSKYLGVTLANKPSVHVNDGIAACRRAKLLKTSIGVHEFCKSSSILQALNISKIESIIDRNSLELIRSMLSSSSRARPLFYIHLIKQHASGEIIGHKDLISRVKVTCEKYGISFLKYVFDDSYS